ncbi:MAG: BMP family ABC transporter substrate-binding protein [Christensenellales bacterium]
MKKFIAIVMVAMFALSMVACSQPAAEETPATEKTPATEETAAPEATTEAASEYKVAMITDYGDITDQSFNQTTYEACKAFCEDNGVQFSYFKPAGDNTADRVAMIEKAVDEGFSVIVMPGYAFGGLLSAPQLGC